MVTGTDTGVGKTITTAAVASVLPDAVVYKPVQAGTEDGLGDADVVSRLAGVPTHEGIRLPDPMAPVAAARRAGVALPPIREHVEFVAALAAQHDHVLVEGAGGLLVELDDEGHTLRDLDRLLGAPVIVVCRSGLGTLNHTALTREALRGLPEAGLVIGSWPDAPTEIDETNRARLEPLLGAVPADAARLDPARFRAAAPTWLPTLRTRATSAER
ncbi:dethiobiotin synthase [Pseudonocardia sp. WMMC193]|uniref:dethiobiotin synthase n=1 Tax=Pseudonocardia sp. WMMC193 TaxID=2911965 RepID=UPI001F00AC9D|nr:dethiobiotin synthase [Pseudonocardia sp. WMMC193]MCF7549445.1 dethiobiotin synthase [Pseudonocardia sp. WMMC193]